MKESYEYVYKNIKKDVMLSSMSGGTDVIGCLVMGNIFDKVYAGEIQGASLAIDVDIYNDSGAPVVNDDKGELVVKSPFPSMPIQFWNDPLKEKLNLLIFLSFQIFGIMVIIYKRPPMVVLLSMEDQMLP